MKLCALWQHLRKFFESVGHEICFATVVTRKRMSSLDRPIDVLCNVGKESAAIARLKVFKNVANLLDCNCRFDLLGL